MDTTRKLNIIVNNKGIALVYIALTLTILVAVLALSFDLGHMYVVRGELQNAADASALAGAAVLYKDPLNPSAVPTLNFSRANTAATNFINQNKSDGVSLTTSTIATGCWNMTLNQLESCAAIPPTSPQVPAVTATVVRSAGNNGGAISTFFAKIFGVDQTAVSSRQAVAVSGFPGSVPGEIAFPIALSSCMTNDYFKPGVPLPDPPTRISTNTPYLPGGATCETAQWTSLNENTNSENVIADFMNNPSTIPPLQSGNDIWIATGAMASLYSNKNCGDYEGQDVLMPIVTGSTSSTGTITKDDTNGTLRIQGFATFHIEKCEQGAKHVTGYLVSYSNTYPGVRPGGSASNTVTPPLMVQ